MASRAGGITRVARIGAICGVREEGWGTGGRAGEVSFVEVGRGGVASKAGVAVQAVSAARKTITAHLIVLVQVVPGTCRAGDAVVVLVETEACVTCGAVARVRGQTVCAGR